MHYCKWCKKQMSGSHRQHRDNPDFKSKMQIANMPNPNQNYKDRVLKEFENTILANGASHCFECCDYELICSDTKDFISKALDNQMKEVMIAWEEGDSFNSFKERLKKSGLI